MVHGKFLSPLDDISACLRIRHTAFKAENENMLDKVSMHLLVFDADENPIASGRIRIDEDYNYVVEKIVVLEKHRRNGYGDLALRMMVNRAFDNGAREVFAGCHKDLFPFFNKVGFEIVKESDAEIKVVLKRDSFIFPCKNCGHNN